VVAVVVIVVVVEEEVGEEVEVVLVVFVVLVVLVVLVTNKDWGPQNKLPELILEFAWCSLSASTEFSTFLKNNFGVGFWLLF